MSELKVYFITDGTKYHDSDIEEVYGAVVTYAPRSKVERITRSIKRLLIRNPDITTAIATKIDNYNLTHDTYRTKMVFIPYDWESCTNVIGVK